MGWILESIFSPQISSFSNRVWLNNLTGQIEVLANATKIGLHDLNVQLQATSRMTLQNRLALDLMLLHENGVCGYLKLNDDKCYVHIPNVTEADYL